MTIVISGANGQVGRALQAYASAHHLVVQAYSHAQCDITNPEALAKFFSGHRPNIFINAAAYTAVDLAETHEAEAFQANADGPRYLAELCKAYDCLLVHFSTDYVFDGKKSTAYLETDTPSPINVYGASKLAGEQAIQSIWAKHLIFRVSWVFSAHGNNFVKTIQRLAMTREHLNVVSDQRGCPTAADSIAQIVFGAIAKTTQDFSLCGLYHYCDQAETTWYDFAQTIVDESREFGELSIKNLNAIPTLEYPTPAKRPLNSILDTQKFENTFQIPRKAWHSQLKIVLKELHHGL